MCLPRPNRNKPYDGHYEGWRKVLLDPNAIETLTLFMLAVAAFSGVFLAEEEEDADGRAVLDVSAGSGLLYWPLLATMAALTIPIGYEFFFAEDGMLQKYFRCCDNWIAGKNTDMLPLVDDLGEATAALEAGHDDRSTPGAAGNPDGDEALGVGHAENVVERVENARLRAQVAALTRAKEEYVVSLV